MHLNNRSGVWTRLAPWALAAALLGAPAAALAQTKIGFVNLDRILRDAAPAVRAQKKIEGEFAKRDQELGRMAEQLKKLQDTFEKNAPTMGENERRNKEREINDANREFQRKQREFREDLNQRRNEELAGVLERANRAVRQIAEVEKYDIVFQEAVWADPRVDITDKVIKALDDSKPAAK
ncbi:MAG TPA: OmpH family outer membrane protein [Burkholderiales bacterium]|nr:OmpH family outer membrane protein [Burkholderiales bacterium]